jgi:hypothetical protein
MLTIVEKLVERELVKQQQANFITSWSSSAAKEAGNIFHNNSKASMQAHLLGYMGLNLGEITHV